MRGGLETDTRSQPQSSEYLCQAEQLHVLKILCQFYSATFAHWAPSLGDTVVGGLILYYGFFFFLFSPSNLRDRRTELSGNRSHGRN